MVSLERVCFGRLKQYPAPNLKQSYKEADTLQPVLLCLGESEFQNAPPMISVSASDDDRINRCCQTLVMFMTTSAVSFRVV